MLFQQEVVIPSGRGLQRLQTDKGGKYTGDDYTACCLETGIRHEFASTNTPEQIKTPERDGRTLAGIVRCILTDSGLPKFLWGELMVTAAFLANRWPHAALKQQTPYKIFRG